MRIAALALATLAMADPIEDLRAWSSTQDGAVRVSVRCASSLPEGAQVHVSLARIVESLDGESRQLVPLATSEAPRVSRRKVGNKAVAAEFEKVEEGSYLVTARFKPDAQPDDIAAGLPPGTAEARRTCPLLVGAPPEVLSAVSKEESAIRATFNELLKIGTAPGPDAKERLTKWFEEESKKAGRSWLPATRDFLRTEVRRIAIWGKGPLRGSGDEAQKESNWREFHDMMFTARHLILRERFLWDLRIAATLAMEMKASADAWNEVKDRQKASWEALDAGFPEGRAKELVSVIGEPAARLIGRIRKGREIADRSDFSSVDDLLRGLQDDEPAVRAVPKYAAVK
ncbi:MAG TPA: hypothetical protein VFC86_14705 [Planctomycetota bacterium]|nr:hypothetical protein [Planctomycetota bacterium]